MQQRIALSGRFRPAEHFRIIDPCSDETNTAGLMEVHGGSAAGLVSARSNGPPDSGQQVIDFARCSYLGLDNHPLIVSGAIEAIETQRSLQGPVPEHDSISIFWQNLKKRCPRCSARV